MVRASFLHEEGRRNVQGPPDLNWDARTIWQRGGPMSWWQWLESLPSGAATFVGALTGSSLGLLAILIGALFNAYLNRRRDDRLQLQESRVVAAALKAELRAIVRAIHEPLFEVTRHEASGTSGTIWIPDLLVRVRLMPELLPKLGLLDVETIEAVTGAYLEVEDYSDHFRSASKFEREEAGTSREIGLHRYQKKTVEIMKARLVPKIEEAIKRLEPYVA